MVEHLLMVDNQIKKWREWLIFRSRELLSSGKYNATNPEQPITDIE